MAAETKREIQNWLLVRYDTTDIYDEIVQDRLDGTCNWILDNPSFLRWHRGADNDPRTLWINAPAGFGKTILAARIIQYLLVDCQGPVVHFFFSAAFDTREDPLNAVRSWLAQIISRSAEAFEIVRQEFDVQKTNQAKRTSLANLLRQVVHYAPNCTLVVDGLDECTTRSQVTSFLELVEEAIGRTSARLVAVSRDVTEIRSGFNLGFAEVKITPENVRDDVQCYSQSIIEAKLPNKSGDIKRSISSQMTDRCEGQFLWVKIQANSLKKSFNQTQLQKSIDEAPAGLDRLYERDWSEIQKKNKRDITRATSLLRWAAFSLRPLSVYEMVDAVLLRTDTDDFPEDELPDDIDAEYINEEILGLCGSLLEVHHTTEENIGLSTIHLPHFTVKQFLLVNLPNLTTETALQRSYEASENLRLGELCLRYVLSPYAWQGELKNDRMRLRGYAAISWDRHCRLGGFNNGPDKGSFLELTMTLFNETHPSWQPWRKLFDLESEGAQDFADEPIPPKPLYFACLLDLQTTATLIMRTDSSGIHHISTRGRNPLHPAAAQGLMILVKNLLDAGSPPDMRGWNSITPLHLAADGGHGEVVNLLLERGADITAQDNFGMTPLYLATVRGHGQTAQLLLSRGAAAKIDGQTDGGWTALTAAADRGHVWLATLLLDHGANISLPNDEGATPLYLASLRGHLETVKLLLARGADQSEKDEDGFAPLHAAVGAGYIEVAKLLLDQGADITLATDDGLTPLYSSCQNGQKEIVALLLAEGADPTTAGPNRGYPMMIAADLGQTEIVEDLLEWYEENQMSTDDVVDTLGHTPLFTAARAGQDGMVKVFLTARPGMASVKNWRNITPLSAAARNGHLGIVEMLLKHGSSSLADKDAYDRTAYDWASRNEDEPMKTLLLSAYNKRIGSEPDLPSSDAATKSPAFLQANPWKPHCDACGMDLRPSSKWYACTSCRLYNGIFAVCADCKDWGETCMGSSHEMEVIDHTG